MRRDIAQVDDVDQTFVKVIEPEPRARRIVGGHAVEFVGCVFPELVPGDPDRATIAKSRSLFSFGVAMCRAIVINRVFRFTFARVFQESGGDDAEPIEKIPRVELSGNIGP